MDKGGKRGAPAPHCAPRIWNSLTDTITCDLIITKHYQMKIEDILFQQLLLMDNHVTRACDSSL